MIIKRIYRKGKFISISFDNGKEVFSTTNFIADNRLFKGLDIGERFESLERDSKQYILKEKLNFYKFQDKYSKSELSDKLKSYSQTIKINISQNDIQSVVEESNYNEDLVLKNEVEKLISKKKGKLFIINKLFFRGFSKEKLRRALEEVDLSDNLILIIKRKSEQLVEKDTRKRREKLIRFGLSRGYEYDKVKNVVDRIIKKALNI